MGKPYVLGRLESLIPLIIHIYIYILKPELSGRRHGIPVKTPQRLDNVYEMSCLQIC